MKQFTKLTREQVIAKYAPMSDPLWTAEVEAKFFAGLPASSPRQSVRMDDEKAMLIREFAEESLNAVRLRDGYVSTLGCILGLFADVDLIGGECRFSQRDHHLGTAKTIRTIQAQMITSGLMVRKRRTQGHGFVGDVLIYLPPPSHRHRTATPANIEATYRAAEGLCPYLDQPSNLSLEYVPF